MADHTPLPVPDLAGKTKPVGSELTEKQQEMYNVVLEYFDSDDYVLPEVDAEGKEEEVVGKLMEAEKFWLTYECLLRYLRAVKWSSADAAIKRLEATLKWRRSFGWYDKLTPEHVEPESVTGKADVFGFDVNGRPALYLTPSKQNTQESPRQIEFTFFMVERLLELMGPGVETLALMINFGDRGKQPSMSTSRTVLDILQNHYPERLGRAIVINIPFVVNMFLKIIMPFVDPVTRDKVQLNPKILESGLFTADQLKKTFGGDRDFEYEHEQYWPELLRMTSERRQQWLKTWRDMGGRVGLKEWDFKGGNEQAEPVTNEKVEIPIPTSSSAVPASTDEKVHALVEEVPVEEPPSTTAVA